MKILSFVLQALCFAATLLFPMGPARVFDEKRNGYQNVCKRAAYLSRDGINADLHNRHARDEKAR